MKKTTCFFIIAFMLICLCGCGQETEEPFVVRIGAEKVYQPEFRFYFLLSQLAYENEGGSDIWLTTINGVRAEEAAKDRTLESIARVKVSCAEAGSLGIEIVESDSEIINDTIEMFTVSMEGYLDEIGVTQELLRKIVEEGYLYGKVFNELTKNIQISEKDFAAYYESYINDPMNNIQEHDDLQALSDELRVEYTNKIKNDAFTEQYSKWEAKTEIEKNQEEWDSIHIIEH